MFNGATNEIKSIHMTGKVHNLGANLYFSLGAATGYSCNGLYSDA